MKDSDKAKASPKSAATTPDKKPLIVRFEIRQQTPYHPFKKGDNK